MSEREPINIFGDALRQGYDKWLESLPPERRAVQKFLGALGRTLRGDIPAELQAAVDADIEAEKRRIQVERKRS